VDPAVLESLHFAYASSRTSTPSVPSGNLRRHSLVLRREECCASRHLLPANIRFNEGVLEGFVSANGEPCLVILDDLLNDVYSQQVCELFTTGCHHRNISVILIAQNLFHQDRFCRDISLNAHYLVTLKNIRDKKQFIFEAGQVYPEDSIILYNSYLDATQEPHGYILLDLTQSTNDGLRFRTNVFPKDIPLPHHLL